MQAVRGTERARGRAIRYETSLDRVGLALATGGSIGGVIVATLVIAGGRSDSVAIAASLSLGALFSAIGLITVAAPLWMVCHIGNRRSGRHAAAAGTIAGSLLFVGARSHGFGVIAGGNLIDALATWAVVAGLATATALAMWRVAYRRV